MKNKMIILMTAIMILAFCTASNAAENDKNPASMMFDVGVVVSSLMSHFGCIYQNRFRQA